MLLPVFLADGQSLGAEKSLPFPHVPAEWAQAAERLEGRDVHRAVVIGPVDSGKSTFCGFLLGKARQSARGAALLDSDVGQKTIGPPACVTLGDANSMRLSFVGTTNPVAGWRHLIDGIRFLADQAEADLLIANTSGLLAGPGRRLKAAEIDALQPDLVIAIGEGADLEAVLSDHQGIATLRLPRSPEARRKTDGERRAIRREAFRRYFAGAAAQMVERRMIEPTDPDIALPAGLLLGLADRQDSNQALGILLGSPSPDLIEVLTPAPPTGVGRIVPGSLCLDENFAERPLQR